MLLLFVVKKCILFFVIVGKYYLESWMFEWM